MVRLVPQPSRNRLTAFTLIELLVVVAIMALAAGMVVAVYDNVQQRAEEGVARQQLATVRDALLRFRVDMGYFPGEGPLAPTALNLDAFRHVDGNAPDNEFPDIAIRQQWATHPMNLWMLFEKPVAIEVNSTRWDWKSSVKRGWNGPYLGHGTGARLDAAGEKANGFLSGLNTPLYNRLYAVSDLIGSSPSASSMALRWVAEDRGVIAPGLPNKSPLPMGGRPIAFIADPVSESGWVIYRLVSAGPNGIFQSNTIQTGDDIVIEVSRRRL